MKTHAITSVIISLLTCLSIHASAATTYVSTDGLDVNDGLSWGTAKQTIQEGVDAAVFYSPSAVQRFAEVQLDVGDAAIACIGDATASAARNAGLVVDVVCEHPTNGEMVVALARHFDNTG